MKGGSRRKGDGGGGSKVQRRADRSPITLWIQCDLQKQQFTLPGNSTVNQLLAMARQRMPGCTIDALMTCDGCDMEPGDRLVDLLGNEETLYVVAGKPSRSRLSYAVMSSSGISSALPRSHFPVVPAVVRSKETWEAMGNIAVSPEFAETIKVVHVCVNGGFTPGMSSDVCVNGVGMLCRASASMQGLKMIDVEGKEDGMTSVGQLVDLIRAREGGLVPWCHLDAFIITTRAALPGLLGPALSPESKLPALQKDQHLVVATRLLPCLSPQIGGERRAADAVAVVADPYRHDDVTRAIEKAMKGGCRWLRKLERCATITMEGNYCFGDEVTFSGLTTSGMPGPGSSGRIAMRILPAATPKLLAAAAAGRAGGGGSSPADGSDSQDEKSDGAAHFSNLDLPPPWAALPPHPHVIPLLFVAGPNIIFTPHVDASPIANWLSSPPVSAFSDDTMRYMCNTIAIQTARGLAHFHSQGLAHLGICMDNLFVRSCSDMRLPLHLRAHIMITDFCLTSVVLLGQCRSDNDNRGGIPGYWAPEQVPRAAGAESDADADADADAVADADADADADVVGSSRCDRWGDSPPSLRKGFEGFVEAVWRAKNLPGCGVFGASPSEDDWKEDEDEDEDEEESEEEEATDAAWWTEALTKMWETTVDQSVDKPITEGCDSWGWAMTMIMVVRTIVEGRPGGAEGVAADNGLSWNRIAKQPLGLLIANCFVQMSNFRPRMSYVASQLALSPRVHTDVWYGDVTLALAAAAAKGAGEGAGEVSYLVDEYLCDLPCLVSVARARVYVCSNVIGSDDYQTRRAEETLVKILCLTNMHVLPDMSVKALPGAFQLDEVLQLAGIVVNWYHTKGPESIKAFYGRYSAKGDSSNTSKLQALGLGEGASSDVGAEPGDLDVELTGVQLSYISSLYNLAMAVEGYGRRLDSLVAYEMLEEYLKYTVGEHHPISAVASVNIERLKVSHSALPLSERHQVPSRMREVVAKYLWEHNVTCKQRELMKLSPQPPPPRSKPKPTDVYDDSDCPITGPIGIRPGGFEFPYAHTCPGALLLGLAHAYAAVPPEMVEDADAALTRRGEALRYTLYALSVIGSTSGENSWKVAAPLSLAVKLCKLGVCAGDGPALDKALEYAQRAAKVLGKAMGVDGQRIKLRMGRGGGEGGGPRRAPSRKLLGGYTNIYMEYSAADLANAYVALAEVERSKGMVTEAGQHFTMAGDILLRHSNETSNSVNGDKSGTRGGKDMDGLASSDKLGSSASWPTASGAARVGAFTGNLSTFQCAVPGCTKTGQFQCSSCKLVRYCSVECQKDDWKRHRSSCKREKSK